MIDKSLIKQIPDSPGVYIFKKDDMYLYIGKSKNLKNRVRTHLNAKNNKSEKFSKESNSLTWIVTAGELGAEVREARMIKELNPIYNRKLRRNRNMIKVDLVTNQEGYLIPQIVEVSASDEDIANISDEYIFDSKLVYNQLIRKMSDDFGICPIVIGLEKGNRCFRRMLKKCDGACEGTQDSQEFNEIVLTYMQKYRISFWQYDESIKIVETHQDKTEIFEIDDWKIVGIYSNNIEQPIDLSTKVSFDEYRILRFHCNKINSDIWT